MPPFFFYQCDSGWSFNIETVSDVALHHPDALWAGRSCRSSPLQHGATFPSESPPDPAFFLSSASPQDGESCTLFPDGAAWWGHRTSKRRLQVSSCFWSHQDWDPQMIWFLMEERSRSGICHCRRTYKIKTPIRTGQKAEIKQKVGISKWTLAYISILTHNIPCFIWSDAFH